MKILKLFSYLGLMSLFVLSSCEGGGPSQPDCGSPETPADVQVIIIGGIPNGQNLSVDITVEDLVDDCIQRFILDNQPYTALVHDIRIPLNHNYVIKAEVSYTNIHTGYIYRASGESVYNAGDTDGLTVQITQPFIQGELASTGPDIIENIVSDGNNNNNQQ